MFVQLWDGWHKNSDVAIEVIISNYKYIVQY